MKNKEWNNLLDSKNERIGFFFGWIFSFVILLIINYYLLIKDSHLFFIFSVIFFVVMLLFSFIFITAKKYIQKVVKTDYYNLNEIIRSILKSQLKSFKTIKKPYKHNDNLDYYLRFLKPDLDIEIELSKIDDTNESLITIGKIEKKNKEIIESIAKQIDSKIEKPNEK